MHRTAPVALHPADAGAAETSAVERSIDSLAAGGDLFIAREPQERPSIRRHSETRPEEQVWKYGGQKVRAFSS